MCFFKGKLKWATTFRFDPVIHKCFTTLVITLSNNRHLVVIDYHTITYCNQLNDLPLSRIQLVRAIDSTTEQPTLLILLFLAICFNKCFSVYICFFSLKGKNDPKTIREMLLQHVFAKFMIFIL